MEKDQGKEEKLERKGLLRTQLYRVASQLKGALSVDEEKKPGKSKKGNNEDRKQIPVVQKEVEKKEYESEREYIQDILRERADFFEKRTIVGDIICFNAKVEGKEKLITQFKCKYGLDLVVENLNSFLDFCSTHGFIPMVDKIIINNQDVTQMKELFTLFSFAFTDNGPNIRYILDNEINKQQESLQEPIREAVSYIQQLVLYTVSTYQYLLGDNIQKTKNIGALSENVFAEVALRMENQMRDKLGIVSSYMKLAGYQEDVKKKTDMHFILKRTPTQAYLVIPTQFTIGQYGGLRLKEDGIEKYLLECINKNKEIKSNFILLAVNGEFKSHIQRENTKEGLTGEYNQWLDSPNEREKTVGKQFPLFINTLSPEIIKPAEIMYIALHMLYKKFDFKNQKSSAYLRNYRKTGMIDPKNKEEINGIKLSEIQMQSNELEEVENKRPGYPSFRKFRFSIEYRGEQMGAIVVYAI